MVGIYKITSPTGKIYIGQSWNIKRRVKDYKNGRAKGQPYLHNSLVKYGKASHKFEVIHKLEETVTQEDLNYWETLYWQKCKDEGINVLNVKEPGSNGKHSEESKRKVSEAMKGKPHPKLTCPHCNKEGGNNSMIRWHFSNCKQKPTTININLVESE